MSSQENALVEPAHRNHGLFSDYYLEKTLPETAGWAALVEEARPIREKVRKILADYTPTGNEAQTEEALIRPILRELGHDFRVQAPLQTPGGAKVPDYVLYRDRAALEASGESALTEESLAGRAFAVGESKHWDRPLDVSLKGGRDTFTNRNPSYQISFYISHAAVEWGILTNGHLWRLYHRDSAHRLNVFYEADLTRALDSDEDFLYLYAFFRRAAFDEPGGPATVTNEGVLNESAEYARGVGEGLRQQVYDALRHLSQGFLDHPSNDLAPEPDTLREVYDASLITLYRLLFVLYAESRGLLPLAESEEYRDVYSLNRIKHEAADRIRRGYGLRSSGATLWPRLRELFSIIDRGSPPLSVATFNGGLFAPARHPFLEEHAVGDARLQLAIDRLARVEGEFVDYRDLAERHLGTIYESLLEFHPVHADPDDEQWSVDLVNDKGERHTSGAYYTPDYVVKYIVGETLGPLLDGAAAGKEPDEAARDILALDVLDPAMGSGHFLVEATEYIARFLIEKGASREREREREESEAELTYWKRRVAQSCVYGVDLNPLAVELAKLSLWLSTAAKDRPLSFLDHHLRAGNSLVGASVNALQTAPTKKRRAKDSGPGEDQLSMLSDDGFRRSMSTAVSNMWVIEDSPAETVEEVKRQEEIHASLREELTRRYARLADLSTATRFGLTVDRELFRFVADHASGRAPHALPPQFERWLDEAAEMAGGHGFFHFELEFPEVFFDRYGRPLGPEAGFDAVVGNPPYVRQESLREIKPYLAAAFPETYDGKADLYVYFYQQGLQQTRAGGRMGYIVTNKWLRAGYGAPLRRYFAASGAVEKLVDFGHADVFPDADVFPCILILHKPGERHGERHGGRERDSERNGEPSGEREAEVASFPREELRRTPIAKYVAAHAHRKRHSRFSGESWSLEPAEVDDLMDKLRQRGTPLAEFAGVEPYRGVLTGLNDAFLIDTATKERLVREEPRSREIIKPYLRGQDIKRWSPDWQNLWMIFARRGINIDAYPAVKNHLAQYRDRLEPKPKDHNKGSWKGRASGSYEWYELQNTLENWQLFEHPKIVYQEIQFHPRYSFDDTGVYANNKVFVIPSGDLWLLAVLNSPLMWWHNWRHLPHMKDEALTPVSVLMDNLPIAEPTDEARDEAEQAAGRLTELRREDHAGRRETLDWLRVEFEVDKPGQKLEDFAALEEQSFIEEVRKRRPKSAPRLSPAALKDLRRVYAEQAHPLQDHRAEAAKLERRLSDLVNEAYSLTEAETELLWRTAPPRMPRF